MGNLLLKQKRFLGAFNPVNVPGVHDCLGSSMTFINPAGNHAFPRGKSWSRHIFGDLTHDNPYP